MFERYTQQARRVVFFARYEAGLRDAAVISTPYLVLGLKREGLSPALMTIALQSRLKNCAIESGIPPSVYTKSGLENQRDIPLENDAKKALAWAAIEANSDGSRQIEPEHLLRGLLCFDNAATEALKSVGFDLSALRAASNTGSKAARFCRRICWKAYLLFRDSIWPTLWRVAIFFAVMLAALFILSMFKM